MAGDGYGKGVGTTGLGDCPNRSRMTDFSGQVGVADGRADGYFSQRFPDALWKGGAAHVEREVEADLGRLDETDNFGDPALECVVAADQVRFGKSVLELLHQGVRIVGKGDGADAFFRGRDKDGTERAFAHGEAEGFVFASVAEGRRFHTEEFGGLRVEASVGIVASAVDCLGHRISEWQLFAHPPCTMSADIGLGGKPGGFLEDAMKIKGTYAHGVRERVQIRRFLGFFDDLAGSGDNAGMLFGEAWTVGMTTLAGAEARSLGLFARSVKGDVLTQRETRRTGWTAIDAS